MGDDLCPRARTPPPRSPNLSLQRFDAPRPGGSSRRLRVGFVAAEDRPRRHQGAGTAAPFAARRPTMPNRA